MLGSGELNRGEVNSRKRFLNPANLPGSRACGFQVSYRINILFVF